MSKPQRLNPFYQVILSFIRNTPLSRGKARRFILKTIKNRVSHPIVTSFHGVPFILNLDNTTEAKALFGRYNLEELGFMKASVSAYPSPVFVDLGANSGFYTQHFLAGRKNGMALAIEPNPGMCARIKDNYALLPEKSCGKLIVECCAVGAEKGQAYLDLSQGLGNAQIIPTAENEAILVKISPLLGILAKYNIGEIHVMKVDIEGYEDKALIPFFEQANPALFPRHIIIEHTSSTQWQSDLFAVLKEKGYVAAGKTRGNMFLTLG